ncbi:VWA domain-containing protein [Streptomyces sp. NPDC127033]|uniref:VWA domain-containing protein n=1 Tax=Streptomyces sp. NPDC127033 TaxID=3347110 RepID=UPI00365F49F9
MRITSRATRGAGARRLAGVLLALAGLIAVTGAAPGHATGAPGRTGAVTEGADPIDFAVVVDQSDSLSQEDLDREVEAAALIAQGEISDRSRATVIGFGSSEKHGQTPVTEVCPPTVVDSSGRSYLNGCVKKLSRRDARMGPGTDFPAALRQALTRLTQDDRTGTPKVIFLLTDGKLDVRDSPEYGADAASRQSDAARQLGEQLARAREESVQIWPLGFGDAIDRDALKEMAEGGFRNGCAELPSATPRMRVVGSAAGIDKALQETFAAARCAQVVQGTEGKPPADLYVTIPKIATDGSITVSKHDPKVSATYYDPRGRKVRTDGSSDGSTFEITGQSGPVEALRVKNPRPGRWRVHLEAPEGHRERVVAVRAIWQGQLRSSVILDPASPRPGEKTTVEVRMQTRRGVVIDDPDEVKGITVAARLTGSGFEPVSVPLKDDGRAPDTKAADVRFTGTLTVPSTADGDLALTAEMSAPGVTSDHRPFNARITSGPPPVTAALTVERATVHPGGSITGLLKVDNKSKETRTLRLALADQPPGAELTVSPAQVEVATGEGKSVPFRIGTGSGTAPGEIAARVTVTDTVDGGRVLDNTFLEIGVDPVPTWWDRWWWAVAAAGALALALAVFAAVWYVAQRRRRDLAGVKLELRGEGVRPDELTVRAGQSPGGEFHFMVDRARGAAPSLQRCGPGTASSYRLRRTPSGEFLLKPPQGRERALRPEEAAALGDGFEVVVHDRRAATGRGRGARDRNGPRTRSERDRARGRTRDRRDRRDARDTRDTRDRSGDGDRDGARVRPPRPSSGGEGGAPGDGGGSPSGGGERRAGASRFDPNF